MFLVTKGLVSMLNDKSSEIIQEDTENSHDPNHIPEFISKVIIFAVY